MRRTIVRFADWLISPDTCTEAPPIVYEMQCTTCESSSDAGDDFEKVRDWAFRHVGRNPSHTGYREVIHRFWRAYLVG